MATVGSIQARAIAAVALLDTIGTSANSGKPAPGWTRNRSPMIESRKQGASHTIMTLGELLQEDPPSTAVEADVHLLPTCRIAIAAGIVERNTFQQILIAFGAPVPSLRKIRFLLICSPPLASLTGLPPCAASLQRCAYDAVEQAERTESHQGLSHINAPHQIPVPVRESSSRRRCLGRRAERGNPTEPPRPAPRPWLQSNGRQTMACHLQRTREPRLLTNDCGHHMIHVRKGGNSDWRQRSWVCCRPWVFHPARPVEH